MLAWSRHSCEKCIPVPALPCIARSWLPCAGPDAEAAPAIFCQQCRGEQAQERVVHVCEGAQRERRVPPQV